MLDDFLSEVPTNGSQEAKQQAGLLPPHHWLLHSSENVTAYGALLWVDRQVYLGKLIIPPKKPKRPYRPHHHPTFSGRYFDSFGGQYARPAQRDQIDSFRRVSPQRERMFVDLTQDSDEDDSQSSARSAQRGSSGGVSARRERLYVDLTQDSDDDEKSEQQQQHTASSSSKQQHAAASSSESVMSDDDDMLPSKHKPQQRASSSSSASTPQQTAASSASSKPRALSAKMADLSIQDADMEEEGKQEQEQLQECAAAGTGRAKYRRV